MKPPTPPAYFSLSPAALLQKHISIFPSVKIGIHYHANVGAGPDHTKCHCGTLKSFCQVRCLPCARDGSGFAYIKGALSLFFLH